MCSFGKSSVFISDFANTRFKLVCRGLGISGKISEYETLRGEDVAEFVEIFSFESGKSSRLFDLFAVGNKTLGL